MQGYTKALIGVWLLAFSLAPIYRSGLTERINFWHWLLNHTIFCLEPATYVPRELVLKPHETYVLVPRSAVQDVMQRHGVDEDEACRLIVEQGIKALLPEGETTTLALTPAQS